MMFHAFVLTSLVLNVHCWNNEDLMRTLRLACPPKNLLCPREQYGLFDGFLWEWNEPAILNSNLAEEFRNAIELTPQTLVDIKEEFCCRKGPCLFRCGYFPKNEIDLIRAFPTNVADLFKLNLPVLEPHREFVEEWMTRPAGRKQHKGKFPAEIEEYFDTVHKHQNLIRAKLQQQSI